MKNRATKQLVMSAFQANDKTRAISNPSTSNPSTSSKDFHPTEDQTRDINSLFDKLLANVYVNCLAKCIVKHESRLDPFGTPQLMLRQLELRLSIDTY